MTGQLQQNHDPSARVRALLIAVDTGEYDAETSLGRAFGAGGYRRRRGRRDDDSAAGYP